MNRISAATTCITLARRLALNESSCSEQFDLRRFITPPCGTSLANRHIRSLSPALRSHQLTG